jgi:hypothetical protein
MLPLDVIIQRKSGVMITSAFEQEVSIGCRERKAPDLHAENVLISADTKNTETFNFAVRGIDKTHFVLLTQTVRIVQFLFVNPQLVGILLALRTILRDVEGKERRS